VRGYGKKTFWYEETPPARKERGPPRQGVARKGVLGSTKAKPLCVGRFTTTRRLLRARPKRPQRATQGERRAGNRQPRMFSPVDCDQKKCERHERFEPVGAQKYQQQNRCWGIR